MAQFLALSILCCCAVIALAIYLRDAILAAWSKSGKSSPADPAENDDRDILY
jgi:hypothetical protein